MQHEEMSNAELAFRLREAVRKARAPKFALVVADRLEGKQTDPCMPMGKLTCRECGRAILQTLRDKS